MGQSTVNARLAFGGLLLLGLADLGLINFKLAPDYAEEQAKQAQGNQPVVKTSAEPAAPRPVGTSRSSVAVAPTPPAPTPEPQNSSLSGTPSATTTVAAVDTAVTATPPAPTPTPTAEPPASAGSGEKPGTVSDIMFEIDSNLLTLTAKTTLDDVLKKLKADSSLRIHVRGHSDQLGSREHNLELSRKRAAAVENFFLGSGIARSRITTEAVGGMKPVDPSNTPTAWARNRRVEIEWR